MKDILGLGQTPWPRTMQATNAASASYNAGRLCLGTKSTPRKTGCADEPCKQVGCLRRNH